MPNLPRTAEEKAQQREAKRQKRRGAFPRNRYNDVRAVACDQVKLRYRPVMLPGSFRQLEANIFPRGEEGDEEKVAQFDRLMQLTTRTSWEIMTERNAG